ncbi:hypothetical protein B0H16DRAFT_1462610 [Mycena metata]|uniref:Uncharacterized protein n=1 Tax=Mycena metata TaxID=1033252 RepID=A0AAD7INA1_9AGAR|nr:hypothetical protein B0H16DRAFT_1462610 [Mycena metata]
MSRKRCLTIFLVFCCIFLAPGGLKLLPRTNALVDASTWVAERITQGLACLALVLAVCAACGLASDAYWWLTDTGATVKPTTTPTPAQLEDGTAAATPPHELVVLEVEVAGAEPPTAAPNTSTTETDSTQTQTSTGGKILGLVLGSVFFAYEVARRGVVSRGLPWWENVGAVLLFILRGFEVIFWLAVLLMIGVGVARRARAAALPEEEEVLFEETLEGQPEPEMVPTTASEKA